MYERNAKQVYLDFRESLIALIGQYLLSLEYIASNNGVSKETLVNELSKDTTTAIYKAHQLLIKYQDMNWED